MPPLTNEPQGRQRLGDFEIVREIGRGGMGIVYEARQVSLNRKVALKVISAGLGLSPKGLERFRREAEAAAKLHHTNIVPIYATGDSEGVHYYAMELIEGPSLDQVLRQLQQGHGPRAADSTTHDSAPADPALTGPYMPQAAAAPSVLGSSSLVSDSRYFDTVARMIADVADALEHAHQHGVIHRDIKPSNLLLSSDSRLSVNDFGLARMLEQPGMTMSGEFVGTPRYMSPEQITAGRTPLDHRTDIYSLGATLYELLALRPAFAGERREQVLAQIMYKEPKRPRSCNRKVPVDLETICLKAMEKDPDRRYQTAGEMAADLRRYVNRFAILARRPSVLQRLRKWVRRRPGVAAALVCMALALAVAGFFAYRSHVAEQRHVEEQRRLAEQLQGERRQAAVERALLAAMGGEFGEAETAIGTAEEEGASVGQVEFLRGEVAYYRGEEAEATLHLERAVRLLPAAQSAAARGLLAVSYDTADRIEDSQGQLRELEQVKPITLEDFLYKGYAYAVTLSDLDSGLKLLDEAVQRRPSSAIARLLRAEIRSVAAQDRGDAELADSSIEDVVSARRFLPDNNLFVLEESAVVYLMAAGVYKSLGLDDKFKKARSQAAKDADALAAFSDISAAVSNRVTYFLYLGERQRALGEARQLASTTKYPIVLYCCGWIFYREGSSRELERALATLEVGRGKRLIDELRCCVVAELKGPEAALDVHQQLMKQEVTGMVRLDRIALLFLLGRADLVRKSSQQAREQGLHFPASQRLVGRMMLDYLAGDLSENDLVKGVGGHRLHQNLAHFIIGLSNLSEGNRTAAREHFRAVTKMCTYYLFAYDLSVIFLNRLEKDPTWPPWIAAEKK